MYDVVIIGGSFAGLATAMQLTGYRVLLIDQHPIGSHQSSTCGIPLKLAASVGAMNSIYEVHDSLALHLTGREIQFSLPEPYVTFHYRSFCQAMLAQTDADVWKTRATGYSRGEVTTTGGNVSARLVVDATGWRSLSSQRMAGAESMNVGSRGIETELPIRAHVNPGLHFFLEKRLVEQGYAWIFPCGERTRIGIASAADRPHLRGRLISFLDKLGLEVGTTHGGVMPTTRREPIVGDAFVVGDAAGQCLPVSLEGIRVAIMNGFACGRLIRAALSEECSVKEAQKRYRRYIAQTNRFHQHLSAMQSVVERVPESLLMLGAKACSPAMVSHLILNTYLGSSGWGPEGQDALAESRP